MSYAHRSKPEDPLRGAAMAASGGRCVATLGLWGDPGARRCDGKVEDVWIDENKAYLALCHECRIKSLGYTAKERGARLKSLKDAQVSLLDKDEAKNE